MLKKLAVGNENFPDMIRNNCYYVDKTDFIKTLMESESRVLLITRPRRFGKTLFMDTLKSFLQIDFDQPGATAQHEKLFAGLNILKHSDFCPDFMGQYPVLFLSFKDTFGGTFERAYIEFAKTASNLAQSCSFLSDSPNLLPEEKAAFNRYRSFDYLKDIVHQTEAQSFLADMVQFLSKHFGRQVVLLIDEYDVPLAKSSHKDHYDQMLEFIRQLLGKVLKPQPNLKFDAAPYLKKSVLTGCLRVSKESIFTGVNNFDVNTVCSQDQELSDVIGFTPKEVETLLNYYGMESRFEDVRYWYDGYRFYRSEIYCPWDVINFASKALASGDIAGYAPENFWDKTSGNEVIDEFLGFIASDDADRMQDLIDGKSIDLTLNEKLTYGDFVQHKSQDFWTLLLYCGYLTVDGQLGAPNAYRVRIPNAEIRDSFVNNIKTRFSDANNEFVTYGQDFAKAALAGDLDKMAEVLVPLLNNYISIRDTATKAPAENYYHGFLTALLSCAGSCANDLRSNVEAGDGFADIIFNHGVGSKRAGVIIEIKRCEKPEDMYDLADAALEQIKDKRYTAYLDRLRCSKQYTYGIAFCRKDCAISGGVIKP